MTSTIHYKFRSATDFETIQLPGSSAKVFDIKRAIVKAKDLDRGNTLEFDLNIKNAMTQESYEDDSMLLPRGTRLIVHRLPAAKGQGLLARFARADAGMMQQVRSTWGNQSAAENGYYTVQNNDDDEFVDAAAAAVAAPAYNSASQEINPQIEDVVDDDDEEAKLIAVIPGQNNGSSPYNSMAKPHGGGQPKFPPGVTAPRPTDGGGGGGNGFSKFKHNPLQQPSNNAYPSRPNADPTLRELEQQQQEGVRKKKKGTPRTFHKVDEHHNGKAFETGFTHLLDRGGGQSEATGGKKRDLDYALQLTATPIPEHLQCGICARVVKDALFIPWDEDGRTACDLCMRRGLSENRMTCPLTNQPVGDGVSPDELRPNKGLRKAVEIFVKGVMEKMDEIVQQQEADEEEEREKNEMAEQEEKVNEFEGDASDKGLIMRKGMKKVGKKSNDDFDDFGGDDFGGDVFTVTRVEDDTTENDKESEEEQSDQKTMKKNATATATDDDQNTKNIEDNNISKHIADDMETTNGAKSAKVMTNTHSTNDVDSSSIMQFKGNYQENAPSNKHNNKHDISQQDHDKSSQGAPVSPTPSARSINRREMLKHRAPPAGYVMGPAGSKGNQMQSSSYNSQQGRGYQNRPYNNRGRDSYNNNRGRGMQPYGQRGRGYNQFNNNFQQPPFDEHKQSVSTFGVSRSMLGSHNSLIL